VEGRCRYGLHEIAGGGRRAGQEAAIKVAAEASKKAAGIYKEAPEGVDDGIA
jgi:hypothetical protein